MIDDYEKSESRAAINGQFAEQLRQLRAQPGFVVGAAASAVTSPDGARFAGPGAGFEVPLDTAQLHSVLGGARVTSVRADVEPVKPFAMMPTTPDYSRPDQGVFDGGEVAGSAFVPPEAPEAPAALIQYDVTQDPAYYDPGPSAPSGPPAVTLRELVDTLGMHPGGSALIHQIHQVCGSLPGNVGLLQELSQYVNQPPGQHLPGYMLGGGVVGAGDVTGPGVSTDNAIARYDGTSGNVIQNSGVTIDDSGNLGADGNVLAKAKLLSDNGTAADPTHSFGGGQTTGLYRVPGEQLGFSVSGSARLVLTNGGSDHIITGNTTVQGDLTADDLTADNLDLANPLPVTEGGTGASTAGGARTNLGLGSLATLNTVGTSQIDNDAVTDAKLRNSAALSVIGRSANSTGDPADIAAGFDHQVLRRSGSAIGFGQVNLASSAAVTGALPIANGGTGASTAATARANLGIAAVVSGVQTSNHLISSSMAVTEMTVTVDGSTWYTFEAHIRVTGTTTRNIYIDFNSGGCSLTSMRWLGLVVGGGTIAEVTSRSTERVITNVTADVRLFGFIQVNAGGTYTLRIRRESSGTGTHTLIAGSWIKFTPQT